MLSDLGLEGEEDGKGKGEMKQAEEVGGRDREVLQTQNAT